MKSIVWFKPNDLRLLDHAPLHAAHSRSALVEHVFVFDPRHYRTTQLGNAKCGVRRLSFTFECLADLNKSLHQRGSRLVLLLGRPESVIPDVMRTLGATAVFTHGEIAHEEVTVQRLVSKEIARAGGKMFDEFWGGATLFSPGELPFDPKKSLSHFTAFRKVVEGTGLIASMQPGPDVLKFKPPVASRAADIILAPIAGQTVDLDPAALPALQTRLEAAGRREVENFRGVGGCNLEPAPEPLPRGKFAELPIPPVPDARGAFLLPGGETAGHARIAHYITNGHGRLSTYKETRNGLVGLDYSSKLSPYLASGCITSRQILRAIHEFERSPAGVANDSTYWLVFELLWRDYMKYYALHHGRRIFMLGGPQRAAGKWPWGQDPLKFRRWQLGETGYPLVDANMRELLLTGFMSNRGRQIVASFLVRDLELDWRLGAEHFEATLVDHDVAQNYGNWTYAAGVGADPREDRYFSVAKQGADYDPKAEYIRRWLPELHHLPARLLLDVRQLGDVQRRQFDVTDAMLPRPVCVLLSERGHLASAQAAAAEFKPEEKPRSQRRQRHGNVPAAAPSGSAAGPRPPLCRYFNSASGCPRGAACGSQHILVCRSFLSPRGCSRAACTFAHAHVQ